MTTHAQRTSCRSPLIQLCPLEMIRMVVHGRSLYHSCIWATVLTFLWNHTESCGVLPVAAYYSALARAQNLEECGLTTSRIVVSVLPHVWLATRGRGGGLQSVDDLELNFMEQVRNESIPLGKQGSSKPWFPFPVVVPT